MTYVINDRRGKIEEPQFTDQEVVGMIRQACLETKLPIPKSVLLEFGVRGKQLEQLLGDGLLSFVNVKNSHGAIIRHYYPADFEKYIAPRKPVETESDTEE